MQPSTDPFHVMYSAPCVLPLRYPVVLVVAWTPATLIRLLQIFTNTHDQTKLPHGGNLSIFFQLFSGVTIQVRYEFM